MTEPLDAITACLREEFESNPALAARIEAKLVALLKAKSTADEDAILFVEGDRLRGGLIPLCWIEEASDA